MLICQGYINKNNHSVAYINQYSKKKKKKTGFTSPYWLTITTNVTIQIFPILITSISFVFWLNWNLIFKNRIEKLHLAQLDMCSKNKQRIQKKPLINRYTIKPAAMTAKIDEMQKSSPFAALAYVCVSVRARLENNIRLTHVFSCNSITESGQKIERRVHCTYVISFTFFVRFVYFVDTIILRENKKMLARALFFCCLNQKWINQV